MKVRIYAVALGSLLAMMLPSARASCGPSPGGPPSCEGDGPASAMVSTAMVAAGNPINIISGNKYQRDVDMPALPGVLGLEIVRHYNSAYSGRNAPPGLLGRGWRLSYETDLAESGSTVQIVQADGTRLIFDKDRRHPSLCSAADPALGTVRIDRDRKEYVWTWNDGRQLSFNGRGRLVQIAVPSGEFVSLQYDGDGVLVKVIDPQGRTLTLGYPDRKTARAQGRFAGVRTIETPVGRFDYQYGQALQMASLLRVRYPVGQADRSNEESRGVRSYHYEDTRFPTLLTGISVGAARADDKSSMQRRATFGYDAQGLAILSTHAGGIGKVTLDRSLPGQTTLTNSLGQQTIYRHALIAGMRRLVEVRGPGCASCGETNVRYRYDPDGRLSETVRLAVNGEPVEAERQEFDSLGRLVRIGKANYRNGKAGPVNWTGRYEYGNDGDPAPVLAAWASVVPGKEVTRRIVYNDRRQVVSVKDTGWIPALDGKSVAGTVERTTRFGYRIVNNRSVLAWIDGPLPNGPQGTPEDSDVTQVHHDERGNGIRKIVEPGRRITEVAMVDGALRPTSIRMVDGAASINSRILLDWRGKPERVELTAGSERRVTGFDYGPGGELVRSVAPGGLVTRYLHDAGGRLTHRILPDGSQVTQRQDTEDRLQNVLFHGASGPVAGQYYDYDASGRIATLRDMRAALLRFVYDERGQLAASTDALGVTNRYRYDDAGRLGERTVAADTPDVAITRMLRDAHGNKTAFVDPNGVATRRRVDDFGRKVYEANPDRGITLYRYDQAGRMIARIDESGTATRYRYDHAGRLLSVGADRQPALLQLRYRGSLLVEEVSTQDGDPAHAVERVSYRHDSWGQVVSEERWVARVEQPRDGEALHKASKTTGPAKPLPGLRFVTTTEYDAIGRVTGIVLPDGHRLAYRYVPAGRVGAGQLSAILFDGEPVARDIGQTEIGGVTGFVMGNGIRQRVQLDKNGRVAELVAEGPATEPPEGSWSWRARLSNWSRQPDKGLQVFYRQLNYYDEAGRVVGIDRAADPGNQSMRRARYGYDAQGRLTSVDDDGGKARFRYDAGGNRVFEERSPQAVGQGGNRPNEAPKAHLPTVRHYDYAGGTNRLQSITQVGAGDSEKAWLHHPTGVPIAQFTATNTGRVTTDRRTVYNSARRPIAVLDSNGRAFARYFYNSRGERYAKTLYSRTPQSRLAAADGGITTYSLYRHQRLAAEADAEGRITAHYVYLRGIPVAKIEMREDGSSMGRLWRQIRQTAGLERGNAASSTSIPQCFALHTDHLGTVQLVTDAARRVVWRASSGPFGETQAYPAIAVTRPGSKPFDMRLRLPGQVFDAELGQHYNYLRDYDPEVGRYMTPDPLGLAGGANPYGYVGNDPLGSADLYGLYQIDIHYYMTFFLAVVAGIDPDTANTIALAAQYVDDNDDTKPLRVGSGHIQRLLAYHFVLTSWETERVPSIYRNSNISSPTSPQLKCLFAASDRAYESGYRSAAWIFLGEALHAFQDTFSHRDRDNIPFSVASGFGHGLSGSQPDYTFNDRGDSVDGSPLPLGWYVREGRTLQMEEEVFKLLSTRYGDDARAKSWNEVKPLVESFNRFRSWENATVDDVEAGNADGVIEKKIDILATGLLQLGYDAVDLVRDGRHRYKRRNAEVQREAELGPLREEDYKCTILPGNRLSRAREC